MVKKIIPFLVICFFAKHSNINTADNTADVKAQLGITSMSEITSFFNNQGRLLNIQRGFLNNNKPDILVGAQVAYCPLGYIIFRSNMVRGERSKTIMQSSFSLDGVDKAALGEFSEKVYSDIDQHLERIDLEALRKEDASIPY